MIYIIVAYDKNFAIGKDNKLAWNQPSDLKRFKQLTWGHTVVMGRKTFESIGRPLTNRNNIVISRQDTKIDGIKTIHTIDEIKSLDGDIFIIGGGEVYKNCIDFVDKIFATLIDCEIDSPDTWFPKIENQNWKVEYTSNHLKDDKNQYDYKFINWTKIDNI